MSITGFTGVLPHVKSGRIKLLAVGHNERIKMMPELPTVAETVPGYYNTGWWGLVAPPGMPKPIVERLNGVINKYLNSPETVQRFYVTGLEIATSTPQGYTDLIRNDLNAWRKLIKEAKISVESLP